MIYKQPKQRTFKENFLKLGKYLIAFEVAAFGATYLVYDKLSSNRDFRYKCKQNYPTVLEYYYKLVEFADNNNYTRATDELTWKDQNKLE